MKTRRTIAICDRCGLAFKLSALKAQVVARRQTSLLVCRSCLDEDQPQWFPARLAFGDPASIPNARPDVDEPIIFGGAGWNPVGGPGLTLVCGIAYDFDLYDPLIEEGSCFDYLALEDGFPITQEDDDLFDTELSCLNVIAQEDLYAIIAEDGIGLVTET